MVDEGELDREWSLIGDVIIRDQSIKLEVNVLTLDVPVDDVGEVCVK